MRPSTWKKYISYLSELHVESTSTDINPHLYVSLKNGRYQLSTAHAVYSHEDLYDNFFKAFSDIPLEKLDIHNVLLLGLGLGSVPWMLERNFKQMYYYTAVEYDEEVIRLARKYSLQHLQSPVEYVCADANLYVSQSEITHDLIAMDVFNDDVVPSDMEKKPFLKHLDRLLTPGKGLLMYNRLYRTKADKQRTDRFFKEVFEPVFPQAVLLPVGGNRILMNREVRS